MNGESSLKENIDDLRESVQSLEKADDLLETKKDTPSLDPQNNEVRTGALGLKDVMNLKKEEQNNSANNDKKDTIENKIGTDSSKESTLDESKSLVSENVLSQEVT